MTLYFEGNIDDCDFHGVPNKIRDGKLNWKYKKEYYKNKAKGKYKRRIKEGDIENMKSLCQLYGVQFAYDPSNDDYCFYEHLDKDSTEGLSGIDESGENTGGQLMRMNYAIAANSIRRSAQAQQTQEEVQEPPRHLFFNLKVFIKNPEKPKEKGKASMHFVQAVLPTLKVGDSFTITGGDPTNSDGLHWERYPELFDVFKRVFGRCYVIENLTGDDGVWKFVVKREADCDPTEKTVNTDIYFADQVLMMAVILYKQKKSTSGVTIKTTVCRDYHPDAIIKIGRAYGMTIDDSKPEANDEVVFKKWLTDEKERVITIH